MFNFLPLDGLVAVNDSIAESANEGVSRPRASGEGGFAVENGMASNPTPWFTTFFGPELSKCEPPKNVNTDRANLVCVRDIFGELSKNKDFVVGLFFTPIEAVADERTNQLVQLYNSINTRTHSSPNYNSPEQKTPPSKKLEVVEVALDYHFHRNEQRNGAKQEGQSSRMHELPWYRIPPTHKHILDRLARRFEIKTLSPTLVLLDGTSGRLITKHGLDKMLGDPTGLSFPWNPLPLPRILENVELLPGGQCELSENVSFSSLAGLIIGFYFSAHWCPPCRCFTPLLKQTYSLLTANNVGFQIIFVSSDRSRDSYETYLSTMPWLAVPYHCEEIRLELAALFGIQGIPTLVLTDSNGDVITTDGRAQLTSDPKGLGFPWRPRLVNILTGRQAEKLQDSAAVVLFVDNEEPEIEFAENVLLPAATSFKENHQADKILFFIACDAETSDTLRDLVGLDDAVPLLTIINLPEATWSILEEGAVISQEAVEDMVSRFLNNTLPTIRIGRR